MRKNTLTFANFRSLYGDLSSYEECKQAVESAQGIWEYNRDLVNSLNDFEGKFLQHCKDFADVPAGKYPAFDKMWDVLVDIIEMGSQYIDFTMAIVPDGTKVLIQLHRGKATKGTFDKSPLGKGVKTFNNGTNKPQVYQGLDLPYITIEREVWEGEKLTARYYEYSLESKPIAKPKAKRG